MCNNYCIKCACKVPVFFGHRRVLIEHGSIKTTFDEEYAICHVFWLKSLSVISDEIEKEKAVFARL